MEIEYSLTIEDAIAFHQHHMRNAPSRGRSSVRLWLVCLPIIIGLLVLFGLSDRQGKTGFDFGIGLALFIACSIWLGLLFRRQLLALAVRRQMRKPEQKLLLESRRLVLTPESVSAFGATSAGTTLWSAVQRIDVSRQHAFIYLPGNLAHVVPRRVFTSEADFEAFLETVRRYYEAARTLAVEHEQDENAS
jgi:hypothetical protein